MPETMSTPTPSDLEAIRDRLDAGDRRMTRIEQLLGENSVQLAANTSLTQDVHDLMEVGRAGFRVLGWIGKAARWVGGIAAAFGAVWALFHHKPPH